MKTSGDIVSRDVILIAIISITLFAISTITYFKIVPENYISWIIIGLALFLAVIIYAFRGGALPLVLITRYLPLPLSIISPPTIELKELFMKHILPAIQVAIDLTKEGIREKSYVIIKHTREFFSKELKGINLGNTEAVRKELASIKMYSNISDDNEKKNYQYSLASLISWISRYRNLVMHTVEPDPIDAWFALRTSLIYIRDRYQLKRATLYSQCPKCNTINKIQLHEKGIHWLKEIYVKCEKCKYDYKLKLTPSLISKHYQILEGI